MENKVLYEGKAKKILSYPENPEYVIQYFKDDATAFNGLKKDSISGKGVLNNKISTLFFEYLIDNNIRTHFIKSISDNEMLVKKVNIIKIEVVCRNIASGSLVKEYGFEEGKKLSKPIVEFYYKSDEAGDPMFCRQHVLELGLADEAEIDFLINNTLRVNELLGYFLLKRKILLVNFKLEYGKDSEGNILLADEISPDTCRFWDADTRKKLDKDNFRMDLGNLTDAYTELYNRIK
jgi:phosphoribosylaminoimidazole-succinocarboxamide synthase